MDEQQVAIFFYDASIQGEDDPLFRNALQS